MAERQTNYIFKDVVVRPHTLVLKEESESVSAG